MGERARRVTVPTELRRQVKHEQGCRCGFCQAQKDERELFIHHVVPVSHHERGQGEFANRRENLVALCEPCHTYADTLAIEKSVYLHEIVNLPTTPHETVVFFEEGVR